MLFEKTPERDFEPSYVVDCLTNYLRNLGLKYHLERNGDDAFPVYKAYIYDKQKLTKWIGGGKGFKQQCLASALAECLQHYTAFNTILNYDNSQMPLLQAAKFLNSPIIRKFDKYPSIFKNNEETDFLTLRYNDIDDNIESNIYYPVALTEPRYDKLRDGALGAADSLLWRSHDTGSSLGMTYYEALLHGITEWVERHSFSLFILTHFFENGSNREVKCIDKHSLPKHIVEVIKHIEAQFNDNLSLILLRNDFDIPCVLTLFNRQIDCIVQPKGLACSLHRQYAVEKSIFEAFQCRLLRNTNTEKRERQILHRFNNYPIFAKAYKLAITNKIDRTNDYQDLPLYDDPNVAKQVSTISDRLKRSGEYKIYRHIYRNEPGGLTSLHVLIPGFNESFLIKEGKFVLERIQEDRKV